MTWRGVAIASFCVSLQITIGITIVPSPLFYCQANEQDITHGGVMKKNYYGKIIVITFIAFIGGTLLGMYYQSIAYWIEHMQTIIQPAQRHHCPPSDLVVANKNSLDPFQNNELHWKIAYRGWKIPDKVGFMQAIFNDGILSCYYQWPNPNEEGTYLWNTVQLLPKAEQTAKPHGPYWKKYEKNKLMCIAGNDACEFSIE